MVKIGILTFHNAPNYGAIFQCYALQETVKSLGAECEIINYQCAKINQNNNPDFIHAVPFYTRFYKFFYRRNHIIKRYSRFRKFAYQYLNISAECYDTGNIVSVENKYDKFIVGSDQVWNPTITGNDSAYYLDFVSAKEKKFSYAASFGSSDIIKQDLFYIQNKLYDFSQISCREKSALSILNLCNARLDIDPVLLLEKDQWNKIAASNCSDNYILVYMVQYDWDLLKKALKFSYRHQYKLILIYAHFSLKEAALVFREKLHKIIRMDTISPNHFLGMLKNARIIITNSFHGTAFALIFHKQIIIKIKTPDGIINQRIADLLRDYKIKSSDHEIMHFTNNNELDWIKTDDITNEKRQVSLSYIKTILQR